MSTLFFNKVLIALGKGSVIKSSVSLAFKIFAIFSLIGGFILAISIGTLGFADYMPAKVVLGTIIFEIFFLMGVFSIFQIWWFRAETVKTLPPSNYVVIPVISTLFRALGEIYLALGLAVGFGGMFLMWFSVNPGYLLPLSNTLFPIFSGEGSFIGGITFMIMVNMAAFLVMAIFYFLSETSIVLVEIADNTKNIQGVKLNDSMQTNYTN